MNMAFPAIAPPRERTFLVRRDDEQRHFDPLGTAGVIANSSASIISNNLYDVFGVLRYEQGSAQTPWRWKSIGSEQEGYYREDSNSYLAERQLRFRRTGGRFSPLLMSYTCLEGTLSNCKVKNEHKQINSLTTDPKWAETLVRQYIMNQKFCAQFTPKRLDTCAGCPSEYRSNPRKVAIPNFGFSQTINTVQKGKRQFLGVDVTYEVDIDISCTFECQFKGTQWQCNVPVTESAN